MADSKGESGLGKPLAVWQLVRAVVFLGFAGWFLYNGAIRWPELNRQKGAEWLAVLQPFASKLDVSYDELPQEPAKATFDKLLDARPITPEQVHEILGEPQITQEEHGPTREYYASQWGHCVVTYRAGEAVLNESTWRAWYKTQGDIRLQFILAIAVSIPGLFFLWKAYKALPFSSRPSQSSAEGGECY